MLFIVLLKAIVAFCAGTNFTGDIWTESRQKDAFTLWKHDTYWVLKLQSQYASGNCVECVASLPSLAFICFVPLRCNAFFSCMVSFDWMNYIYSFFLKENTTILIRAIQEIGNNLKDPGIFTLCIFKTSKLACPITLLQNLNCGYMPPRNLWTC